MLARKESNLNPLLQRQVNDHYSTCQSFVSIEGIEPSLHAPKASALPLRHTLVAGMRIERMIPPYEGSELPLL